MEEEYEDAIANFEASIRILRSNPSSKDDTDDFIDFIIFMEFLVFELQILFSPYIFSDKFSGNSPLSGSRLSMIDPHQEAFWDRFLET